MKQHTHPRRRAALAAAAALALATVAGCGDSGSSTGSAEAKTVLTENQVKEALLTVENLGGEFRETTDSEESELNEMGCLSALEDLETREAAAEAEVDYEFAGEMGTPTVFSAVSSFAETGDVTAAFDDFRSAMEDCRHIEFTDEDGATMELDLVVDEEKTTTDVDDQINFTGTGTVSAEGLELPFGLWFSVARVDNHTTMVGVGDLGNSGAQLLNSYTEIAVDRLVAVAAGEEPPNAVAEPLGEGAPNDEEPQEEFESLPLDGGSYTWDSGVTLKLSVERVEPWGRTDDFCGDGSCGIANPQDTRFVLKYEVTVPDGHSGPFDPSSCPGSLHVTTGSDDEALSGVAGDYYRTLGGKIFPGATKYGVEEYYIEKAYADEEFYIESSCGDVDFTGEMAYFVGPIIDAP